MEPRELIQALIAKGLTQVQIGDRIDIGQAGVSKLARGAVCDINSRSYRRLQALHTEVVLNGAFFHRLRTRLGLSQAELAAGIGVTQGNVSHYEVRAQTVPPQVAAKLIEFARSHGLSIGYDHVYGAAELPAEAPPLPAAKEAA